MITYDNLLSNLQKQRHYHISAKNNYFVLLVSGSKYHITVFRDQWDDYENISNLPFHLFHISSDSEQNRCSSYFWVDKKSRRIKKIPGKYFQYNQPSYDFFSSTRSPCKLSDIKFLLKIFQRIINKIQ